MENHEIEFEVTNLMLSLQQNERSIEIIKEKYTTILEEINKKIENESKQYVKNSQEIQEKIKNLVLMGAKSIKTGSGNVTYRKGAVRRSWDLDKLDIVCNINTDVKEKI